MSDAHQHTICPHCGYSLQPDATVSRAGWVIALDYVFYNATLINLSPSKRQLLYSLARAYPHALTSDALILRTSDDSDSNVLTTTICQLRRYLREVNLPVPIRTTTEGYVWSDEPVPHESYRRKKPGVVHGH